ncbi:MAG: anaerobic ribonucleoside-triphosphate reductase activating protein [Clostridiaceae bacterium]|nr:anaerobic ribonucleoside-triphosphate reductase activating protein [Clostridiaceae bacterium]
MNYADIKQYDVANGPGVRVSLFVSGCTHHCRECFNPETWDFNYGTPFTQQTIEQILDYMKPDYVKGLTLLGGEPLEHQNQKGLLPLVSAVRKAYPQKNIWCFTGYDYERDVLGKMVPEWEETKKLLACIDVLVDGEFEIDKKDLGLVFKGSSNQRTILVQESLQRGRVVLWHPDR